MECVHSDLYAYITEVLRNNASSATTFNGSCDRKFISRDHRLSDGRQRSIKSDGLDFYAFVTPFIILVGVLGNSVSLGIFCSPRMRKMSASIYLANLALLRCGQIDPTPVLSGLGLGLREVKFCLHLLRPSYFLFVL